MTAMEKTSARYFAPAPGKGLSNANAKHQNDKYKLGRT